MKYLLAAIAFLMIAGAAQAQSHATTLNWVLSPDDTTTMCQVGPCSQNVYRAAGTCSTATTWVVIASPAATAVTYVDSTVTPGNWCYAVSFVDGGNESVKSNTVTVLLQPSPPSGLTGSAH